MCAILDSNVKGELTAPSGEAGAAFYDWLVSGQGKIVVGGTKTRTELYVHPVGRDRRLIAELRRAAAIIETDDAAVDSATRALCRQETCRSDDQHIIALAQISGARLLYSNEPKLHIDFKNKDLIDKPRGKVYTTLRGKAFKATHRDLLRDPDLCRPRVPSRSGNPIRLGQQQQVSPARA